MVRGCETGQGPSDHWRLPASSI